MNCIWILLILFCCGNNGCGNNSRGMWCDGCGNNNWNWGCNNCNRRGDNWNRCDNNCNRCGNNCECHDHDKDSLCETVCEAACEAVRDNVREDSNQGCGCRRSFPFTSFPVLDNCD